MLSLEPNTAVPPIPFTEFDRQFNSYKYLANETHGPHYFMLRLFTSERVSGQGASNDAVSCGDIPPVQWLIHTLGLQRTKSFFITVNVEVEQLSGVGATYSTGDIPVISVTQNTPNKCETNIIGSKTLTPLLLYEAGTKITTRFKVHRSNSLEINILEDVANFLQGIEPLSAIGGPVQNALAFAADVAVPAAGSIPTLEEIQKFSEIAGNLEDSLEKLYNDRFSADIKVVRSVELNPYLMRGRYLPSKVGRVVNDINGLNEAQIAVLFQAVPSAFVSSEPFVETPSVIYQYQNPPASTSGERDNNPADFADDEKRQNWLLTHAIKRPDGSKLKLPFFGTQGDISINRPFWIAKENKGGSIVDAIREISELGTTFAEMQTTKNVSEWANRCIKIFDVISEKRQVNAIDIMLSIKLLFSNHAVRNAEVNGRRIRFSYADGVECGSHLDQTAHNMLALMFDQPDTGNQKPDELEPIKYAVTPVLSRRMLSFAEYIKSKDTEGLDYDDRVANLQEDLADKIKWSAPRGVIFGASGTILEEGAIAENVVGQNFSKFGCYIRDEDAVEADPNRIRALGKQGDKLHHFSIGFEKNSGSKGAPLITSVAITRIENGCDAFKKEHGTKGCRGGWKPWETEAVCTPPTG